MTLLGRGGMGSVYLLVDSACGRRLALKLLRRELVDCPEHVERFTREASAARRCAHPNVVEVIDTGFLADGRAYILMEYLEGEDLAATLRREGRLPWAKVRPIALQICNALSAAHARGIVHRDLKPGNCFRITRAGNPDFIKVLDFGVAKLLDRSYETLTRPGELVGTLRYMAPEQVEGGKIDFRADIYALGAMLYHMLTGQTAATGSTNLEILYSLMTRPPQSFAVVAPDLILPDGVWPVIARAMAREPAQRFASMHTFAAAIAAIDALPAPIGLPALQQRRPTTAAPAAAPGERTMRPPARAERLPQVLVILVLVFFVCLLWVSGFAALPAQALSVAPQRTPKRPIESAAEPSSSLQPLLVHDPYADTPIHPVTPGIPANPEDKNPPPPKSKRAKNSAASPSTAQAVVDAHHPRYSVCQHQELRTDSSAPRRYALAVTIDAGGRAERVEVLSLASTTMKSCIDRVTRELKFPEPRAADAQAIVTLTFPRSE